ncbi:tetratricopeptide repeat protein [Bdellovibrio sp. HCB337]|uniref:tetratricopeptide repeat protein n=1 Tax=Bdellovibrio sp. HCB337 TaxID=3394358 RepID=UPI0039A5A1E2
MKQLNHFLIFSAIFSGTILGGLPIAYAEKMSAQTQDMVIERMERVISAMDNSDGSYLPSQQRLADLLSERARQRFMLEVEANCNGCKGSTADRLKAVQIYETLLKEVKVNDHGPILFQLAHLHDMAGQPDQAIKLFERIIKESKSKNISEEIVARSHSGLGDLLFQKGNFKEAHKHYSIALKYPKLMGRGLVIYNMAWSEFNLDRLNAGISTMEGLLKKPDLIARESADGIAYDPVFHSDIVRDLATFYARRPITNKELSSYETFSPKDKRKELLLHFASEADRLGQKKAAAVIYNRYLEDATLSQEERLAAFVKLAQVNYDGGDTSKSTQDFAKAAQEFQKNCKDVEKCQELEKTMKRYVTELHRSKKLKPDADLLNAYLIYSKTFPNDAEMAQRGAQIADDMGKHAVAMQFTRSISNNKSAAPEAQKNALLYEISAAEKSKNPVLQKAAYEHYLSVAPKGEKSFEVRYQMAYLTYQQKNHREAAQAFYELAMDKNGKMDLRKKSADLSLDCLVQMKYEDSLEDWAWQYSAAFPQARTEYETMARKALLNRSARIANDKNSSNSDLKKSLEQMQKANMASAKASDKVIFYTNMSVLAQRLNEDEIFVRSLQALIAQPGVTEARREESLGKIVAYFERKLDFKTAYSTALKMKFGKTAQKDKELRLGTLADLAALNPTKHYRAALKAGLKGESARSARSRLVLLSSTPVKELKAQASELAKDPGLLNEMTLLVYARTGDKKGLKSILSMSALRRQTAPNFIAKQEFYSEMESFKARIARHKLNASTDSRLQKTIKERVKLLKEADNSLANSLRFKDVTAQLMALNVVASENERMVRDLVALPVPAKLTASEQKQYLDILKQKSKPYFTKAKFAQQRQNEIWNGSSSLAQLLKDFTSVRPELKKLLRRELQLLAQLPNDSRMHSNIVSALNESTLSMNDLLSARKTVAENPENIRDIENLKNLETKIGHPLMASYLEARLGRIQKGRSL